MSSDTPVMQQYKRIKSQNPDSILFFRLGDFYEMFENDAKEVSLLLDIALTKRHNIPMCGVPYHSSSPYIAKLLKAGRKIAICEQLSNVPPKGKKIVEREVVEIITPGTVIDEDFLDNKSNNYLAAVSKSGGRYSLSYVDMSTGEFAAFAFEEKSLKEILSRELIRLDPGEIIIQESILEYNQDAKKIFDDYKKPVNRYPDWYFNHENSVSVLKKQFNVDTLKGFGFSDDSDELLSAGVIIEYLYENSKNLLPHITKLVSYDNSTYMGLDENSLKNLEILKNLHDSTSAYTLLSVLDYTKTSMGSRTLKKWLTSPLTDIGKIEFRYNCIELFYRNQILLSEIRKYLSSVKDIQRLSSKIAMDRATGKDLVGLKNSFYSILSILELLSDNSASSILFYLSDSKLFEEIRDICSIIEQSIKEEPAVTITDGNIIREGFNTDLDRFRDLKNNSQEILNSYIEQEKNSSQIPNLKIRYNKIIGYFLEVTKSYLDNVPEHFIRRQSLVGAERYTTEHLVNLESELNSASEKIVNLEKQLFLEIRDRIKGFIQLITETSEKISEIDCLQSLAQAATVNGYTRPVLTEKQELNIKNGRHPVVEANLPTGEYVPNDITLQKKNNFILLTGPNMAGKSTYLRQAALIVLMAQAGSFVPAGEAEIGLVDRIFCRVGASDNLARGESTFLVEMSETANILRSATRNSLIIMDEVGRGTSTNDGLSIAWSICEYIIKKIKSRTLFATHYHELVRLEYPEIINLSMNAVEQEGKLIFLKKIKKGSANKSYGINVAEIAGIPYEVIIRGKELLDKYDRTEKTLADISGSSSDKQIDLFSSDHLISREIESLDINKMTPLDALNKINSWKKMLK